MALFRFSKAIAYQQGAQEFSWLGAFANVVGVANLILKASLGVIFMMWVRWSFPRLRIDQVITMCWKYCVPLAAAAFVGSVFFWQYSWALVPQRPISGACRGWNGGADSRILGVAAGRR